MPSPTSGVAADLATQAAGLTPTINPYSNGISVAGTGSSTPWAVGVNAGGQLMANTGFGMAPIYTAAQFNQWTSGAGQLVSIPGMPNTGFTAQGGDVYATDTPGTYTPGQTLSIKTSDGGAQYIDYRYDASTGYYVPSSVQGKGGGGSFFDQVIQYGSMAGAAVAGGAAIAGAAGGGTDALTQAITAGYTAGTAATPIAGSELAAAGVADAGGVTLGAAGGVAGGIAATDAGGLTLSGALANAGIVDSTGIATAAAGEIAADTTAGASGLSVLSALGSAGSLGSALKDIGGAVSDLFGASGASQAAQSYLTAAGIAEENATLEKAATAIQEMQLTRQINKTIGTQEAQVAGAGFAASGSALDILRDSQQQGSLAKAMVREQGGITTNAYEEQANLFKQLASGSESSATSQTLGAGLNAAGALFNVATTPGVGSALSSVFNIF